MTSAVGRGRFFDSAQNDGKGAQNDERGSSAKGHDAFSPNPAMNLSALVRTIAGPMALDFLLMS